MKVSHLLLFTITIMVGYNAIQINKIENHITEEIDLIDPEIQQYDTLHINYQSNSKLYRFIAPNTGMVHHIDLTNDDVDMIKRIDSVDIMKLKFCLSGDKFYFVWDKNLECDQMYSFWSEDLVRQIEWQE